MGIIFKQSLKGSIFIYIGVGIGFLTSGILYPRVLEPEQIGLVSVLIAYSMIIAKIGGLGMQQVITRLFPYFRDQNKHHHGFLPLVMLISAAGFVAVAGLFFLFRDFIIEKGAGESSLFKTYVDLIIPLILFHILFAILDNYNKVLYNATRGTFYQEIVKRLGILLAIVLYYLNFYSFSGFVYGYVLAVALAPLGLFLALRAEKSLPLKPDFSYPGRKLWREMADVGVFGIIASASGILVLQIDRIMVAGLTDLGATGVYSIAFFFGSLVQKPAKALVKISSVFIAEAWKKNDLKEINNLYSKSAINQILVGLILFIGLVVNLENIIQFLGEEYSTAKLVIVFIAGAFLVDMSAGVNGIILNTSGFYRWQTYLLLIMVVTIVLFNLLLIPAMGITGAALATLIARIIFNLSKFLFIYIKWKMQPFNYKFLWVLFAGGIACAAGYFMPAMDNYILDVIIRSALTTIVYVGMILWLRPSDDFNYWIDKTKKKFLS